MPIDFSVINFQKLQNTNCAEMLVRYLELEGVRYVFGVSGGTIISILQAIDASSQLKFVMCKHEGSASFMADMYARVSGITGVCLSTAGPGATNMLTGVACAQQDRVPLLAITGQPATHTLGKGAVQESSEFGVDTVGIYAQFTGFSTCISDPTAFQQILIRALRAAQGECKKAVHLSIPSNVSGFVHKNVNMHTHVKKYRISHASIDMYQIQKAAILLSEAQNPVILVGSGFSSGEHVEGLKRIAEMLSCPVVTTPQGKGLFPESHPLSLGVFGFAGNPAAKHCLLEREIDLLLVVGSRLGEWTTESWNPRIFPTKYFIQIDIDSQNIGQNFPVSLGIAGDVGTAIKTLYKCILNEMIRNRRGKDAEELERKLRQITRIKQNEGTVSHPEKRFSSEMPLKPQRLMYDLNQSLARDAIVLVDAGNSYAWALHYLVINPPQRFFIPLGFASMGHATAGVVGAALAAVDRQVIAIVGDGSMLMNGNEVHTAVEYGVPAIWLVLNDSRWGMVWHGNRAVCGKPLASQFRHAMDYSRMAQNMGASGYRITKPGELPAIMARVMEERKPTVIDAVIDPDEEPPFLERVQAVKNYMGTLE